MPDHRMPKQISFGWLMKARPFHGVKLELKLELEIVFKLRCEDRVLKDKVSLIVWSTWYRNAQGRKKWYGAYHAGMEEIEKHLRKEGSQRQTKTQTALQANVPTVRVAPFTSEHCKQTFRTASNF